MELSVPPVTSAPEPAGELQNFFAFRPELVELLLSHLDTSTLLGSASVVNRLWHSIATSSEVLWAQHVHPELLSLNKQLQTSAHSAAAAAATAAAGHADAGSEDAMHQAKTPGSALVPASAHEHASSSVTTTYTDLSTFGGLLSAYMNDAPLSPTASGRGTLAYGISSISSGNGCIRVGSELGGLPARLYAACHASNFLRNPTLSRALSPWAGALLQKPWAVSATGEAPVYENPPQGVCLSGSRFPAPPRPYLLPAQKPGRRLLGRWAEMLTPEAPGCLATGGEWVEAIQVVDMGEELVARGLSRAQAQCVLDRGLPLGLSVQVASHHAQAGGFAVGLLLDDGSGSRASLQAFVPRPGGHHFFSGYRRLPAGSGWRRFAYVVGACPVGFRRAVVLLRGRAAGARPPGLDGQRTGPRFASASLTFLTPGQAATFGEEGVDKFPVW